MFDTLIEDFEEDAAGAAEVGNKFPADDAEAVAVAVPGNEASQLETTEVAVTDLEDGADESWSDDPVRMYLMQMGQIPLLSREEEISAAKKIDAARLLTWEAAWKS